MNIICLHGFQQSAYDMKEKMKKIIYIYKNTVNFDFIDNINPTIWYDIDDPDKPIDEITNEIIDINKTFNYLDTIFTKKYDGAIGFSQGADILRLYISIKNIDLKFLISIGGHDINNDLYKIEKLQFPIKTRIYIISGLSDQYVPFYHVKNMCKSLSKTNVTNYLFFHDNKHIIPINLLINILKFNL